MFKLKNKVRNDLIFGCKVKAFYTNGLAAMLHEAAL